MFKRTLSIALLLSNSFAFSDTSDEIDHLLTFVEQTHCLYQRNGSDHKGSEARQHIQKKYDYYRDDIKTAEEFIAYSATKGTISGKRYRISCTGEKSQFSGLWLNRELEKYRTQLPEK